MRLTDLVSIDNRFEKAVNLSLDLNNEKKVTDYIPTRSSIHVLCDFLEETIHFTGSRATALIGPYGKGKSHILLVILYLLSVGKTKVARALVKRIVNVLPEVKPILDAVLNADGLFLPVIVNINSSSDNLNQTLIRSLAQALRRDNLNDITPESYFTEAIKIVDLWKDEYPTTYKKLCAYLLDQGSNAVEFTVDLTKYDDHALDMFRRIYPKLTAGGAFNPVVDDDVLNVYRTVNRQLHEKHGYRGIFVVFDEFSKYIEGHAEAGFAEDMKVLQDFCELCNASREEQLHLVCVAHKSIKSYGSSLPKQVLNTFKGVEGRLKEEMFVVSSKNSFELIADAIQKSRIFDAWAAADDHFKVIVEESGTLRCFSSLFDQSDFYKLIGKGCFPLTPLSSALLLELSEKIAQNERTIFTYITSKDRYSLYTAVKNDDDTEFVAADCIYDYFELLFREDITSEIHNEWLKAAFALGKAQDDIEKKIIKSLAVIKMVNNYELIPDNEKSIWLASGLPRDVFTLAFSALQSKDIISYKARNDSYSFKNEVSADVDTAIFDCIKKRFAHADMASCLNEIVTNKYIAPKKHNQENCITRYFNFVFMTEDSFCKLISTSYFSWHNRPDGAIVLLLSGYDNKEMILEHQHELHDECLLLCLPTVDIDIDDKVKHLLAVRHLKGDAEFIDNNPVLRRELMNIEEDLILEIEEWIDASYLNEPEAYLFGNKINIDKLGINRVVSNICDAAYCKTPIINHELINRHEISGQIAKARSSIINNMLLNRDLSDYLTASSAEATIYRATIGRTNDDYLAEIKRIIEEFIHSCIGERKSFGLLFNTLEKAPYGMRRGVIPLFLMDIMLRMDDMPILYLNNREITIDADMISSLARHPEEYSLLIEEATAEKQKYISDMLSLFDDFSVYCNNTDARNKLSKVVCLIQAWYRSLPQTSVTYALPDTENDNMDQVNGFRRCFAENSLNPREVLLVKLPQLYNSTLGDLAAKIAVTRKQIDNHIHLIKQQAECALREELHLSAGDLCQSIHTWVNQLPEAIFKTVVSQQAKNTLDYMKSITTHDEEEIVSHIIQYLTGTYIEDWKHDSLSTFNDALKQFDKEINNVGNSTNIEQKIEYIDEKGNKQEAIYDFSDDAISTSGQFLKNALADAIDEYGSWVDNKEKIGILMSLVKELLK